MASLTQNNSQTFPGQAVKQARRGAAMPVIKIAPKRKGLNSVEKDQVSKAIKKTFSKRLERHFKNTNIDTSVGTTGVYFDITSIAQGDAYNQRSGNLIRPIEVGYSLQMIPNETPLFAGFRIVLFRWLQDTTVEIPSDSVMFEDFTNEKYLSPFKADTRNFQVLDDRKVSAISLTWAPIREARVYNKPLSLGTPKYEATTTTGRDHIYLLLISDNNTNLHDVQGHVWVRFTDA